MESLPEPVLIQHQRMSRRLLIRPAPDRPLRPPAPAASVRMDPPHAKAARLQAPEAQPGAVVRPLSFIAPDFLGQHSSRLDDLISNRASVKVSPVSSASTP